ncbi:unnamed protein product, partial [marine sediment metagenome]
MVQLLRTQLDKYYQIRSQIDDDFYFGLGDRIHGRQEAKVPIAGEGTVQFLGIASDVTRGIAIITKLPMFAALAKLTG